MKNLQYIVFSIFLTVITVGVSISRHYSGGELYSIALFGKADSCCEVPMDCCDDESDIIQFTVEYLNSLQEELHHGEIRMDLFIDLSYSEILSYENKIEFSRAIHPRDAHPPPDQATYLAEIQAYLL